MLVPPLLSMALTSGSGGLGLPSVLLLFLALVVIVAAVGGLWPALFAAVVGLLLANFYFTPPVHTFTIAEGEHILALCVFLTVAGVVSWLVSVAGRRTADAARARAEAETLAALGGTLATSDDPLPQLVAQLRAAFVGRRRRGPPPRGRLVVRRGLRRDARCRRARDVAEFAVAIGPCEQLVVAGADLTEEDLDVLRSFAAQVQVAVERRRLRADVAAAAGLAEANELRTALLAAVSHDLRTPLAVHQGLGHEPAPARRSVDRTEATREFLATIDEESDRLNSLVGNLLDMSRLQTGALQLVMRAVGLEEVVPQAAVRAARSPGAARPRPPRDAAAGTGAMPGCSNVPSRTSSTTPGSWSPAGPSRPGRGGRGQGTRRPAGRSITARASRLPSASSCSSRSSGSGDNPSNGSGVGLGLAVARGFVEAMGGDLIVEDTPGGGTTMVLSMPVARVVSATRVLVVDDEPQILRALGINLRARGYEVDLAPRPVSERSSSRPGATPTSWCSTSACRGSAASR